MNINCTIYWYGYRNRALTSKREVIGEMGCRNRGTIDILFVWDESKYSRILHDRVCAAAATKRQAGYSSYGTTV